MSTREKYAPGPAAGAKVQKDGEKWTLVLERELRHPPVDVLDQLLAGQPIGRMAGPEVMKFGGWQRLNAEYAKQFGVETPR